MEVAYLANRYLDPENPRSWSGLPYFIRRALEGAGVRTTVVRSEEAGGAGRWLRFLGWRLRGRRYLRACGERLLRDYARRTEARLRDLRVEAVFSPGSWLCAYLRTDLPAVFWTDACFAGMRDFYPSFSRLAPASAAEADAVERAALRRCAKGLYASSWAVSTALAHYPEAAGKVEVVPFGGNLQEIPPHDEVAAAVGARDLRRCELLLVGVEWERKGAGIAVEALESLRALGIDARLTVVGCRPPWWFRMPEGLEIVPFISKASAEGRRRLAHYYARSHFFILPSRAEAYGLVLSEAGLHGVPSLSTRVGGIPDIVADGLTGVLFDPAAGGSRYAAAAADLLRDPDRYRAMALRAAEDARGRQSWEDSGRRVAGILEEAAAVSPRAR